MKVKARESSAANELQFELKYCERCGSLWLRPAGGGQIYCVACGRAMGELPPASRKAGAARVPQGPRWGADEDEFEGLEEYDGYDLDAPGGVA
jgi:hypothetical protein